MRDVLVVNQFALPRTEAGGTRHIDLFSRVEGWRPLIVAGDRNHYTQDRYATADDRFRLLRVPKQRGGGASRLVGWLAFGAQAFAACVTRPRVDLVLGSSPQPIAALSALAAARVRRRPFVLEVRDLWPESIVAAGKLVEGSLVHRVFCLIERVLATQATRVVCVTDGWEDHFLRLGVPTDRMVVVPNGTEPSDFKVAESRQNLRDRLSLKGFTAVFAGAHGPKDGVDLVVDAAARLPTVHFLLVGSGPAKAGLVDRVRREHLSNVEFREPVPKVELAELLRACDVGIHAVAPLTVFDKGMSPNKLFDYLAAGLPVVSNAEGALRRIVIDGECGRLGGTSELAFCIEAVRDASAEQRAAWSARAEEVLRHRYGRRAAAATLAEVMNAVVAAHVSGTSNA